LKHEKFEKHECFLKIDPIWGRVTYHEVIRVKFLVEIDMYKILFIRKREKKGVRSSLDDLFISLL